MNAPVMVFIFVCLVIVILIVFVRPRMKPRGKLALPKTVGLQVDMADLEADHSGYDLYYCGRIATPSALVFVPRQGTIAWILPEKQPHGWKRITDETLFAEQLRRVNLTDTGVRNQLKVVLPPGDIKGRTADLCLIYTSGSTTPYAHEGGNGYVLPPVPERTSRDYDRNK
ncbi:hypothetical protein ACTVJH_11300 [Desulfoplanes sp. PS50]